MYVIFSLHATEEYEQPMFWRDGYGWTLLISATVYTQTEKTNRVLPFLGTWVKMPMTDEGGWANIVPSTIEADSSRLQPDEDDDLDEWEQDELDDDEPDQTLTKRLLEAGLLKHTSNDDDFERYIRWLLEQDLDAQAIWITTATDWELETFRRLKHEHDLDTGLPDFYEWPNPT